MNFNDYFKSIPLLETNRLILTSFSKERMDEYFDILRDEKVQKFLGGAVPVFDKEPHISNWLNNINDKLLKRKLVFTWCVIDKQSNRLIGRIDLGGFIKKEMAEISYHFDSDMWGKGVSTEVIGKVTEFGLQELKLKRIQGLVRTENIASIKALEKNGYIKEGILHHYAYGREFHDVVMIAKINV